MSAANQRTPITASAGIRQRTFANPRPVKRWSSSTNMRKAFSKALLASMLPRSGGCSEPRSGPGLVFQPPGIIMAVRLHSRMGTPKPVDGWNPIRQRSAAETPGSFCSQAHHLSSIVTLFVCSSLFLKKSQSSDPLRCSFRARRPLLV